MSTGFLLLLAVLVLLALVPFALMRLYRSATRETAVVTAPRAGLSFQRPVAPVSRAADMQPSAVDKPPMFASFPVVFEGEIAPERLSNSSF